MKNSSFLIKYGDFWQKTAVSEQNTAISDEKLQFFGKIRLILMKNARF